MIRVLFFLALVSLIAFGAVWLADRPGDVVIVWQGYRAETSVMVMATAMLAIVVVSLLLWSIIRTILRSPDLMAMMLSHRRGVRGYLAISRGLVSVGAGDARAARRYAEEADRIAPGEPLALLLSAQVAQLDGDRGSAERAFRAMSERSDTKLIGLRGLYIEARRREDNVTAQNLAEAAAKAAPSLAWAGQAVLEFRCRAADWTGAQAALDRNSKHGLIDRAEYKRQRAVLLTARALAAEESDRDRARSLALDAVKLAPSLVPAAELAGRLLGQAGDLKRAARIVEKAWQANPHPDLADTYAHLRMGDSARERLTRVEMLARKAVGHPESALAVARAAIDAQEFGTARRALEPLLREPTQRVAELMAELEERESGDEGRAREWMARAVHAARDPAWTADGIVSDRWMPVSPVSGRLDSFQWRVPVAELADRRTVIDADDPMLSRRLPAAPPAAAEPAPAPVPEPPPPAPELSAAAPELPSAAAPEAPAAAPEPPPLAPEPDPPITAVIEPLPASEPIEAPPPVSPPPVSAPPRRRRVAAAAAPPPPEVEAVIPLVHAPDDPGPEAPLESEPQPEPVGKRLGLFK